MKQVTTNKTFKNSKLPLFYVYSENIFLNTYIYARVFYLTGSSTNISTTALTLLLMVAFWFVTLINIYDSKESVQFKYHNYDIVKTRVIII